MASGNASTGDAWTYTGVSEFVKVIFLAVGTGLLTVLVWVLATWADVPSKAATGFAYFAGGSIVVALGLVAPWTYMGNEMMDRLGRDRKETPKQRTTLRRETKLRIDRGALGLWIPYVVNIAGVGWLVYYSGGIVHSPFTAVPVVMFTLVVLLIDPPSARGVSRPESIRPPIWPFIVLAIIALVFFVSMALLNIFCPATLETSPTDGAGIAVTLSTAAVGIVVAVVARWNILRNLLESDQSKP